MEGGTAPVGGGMDPYPPVPADLSSRASSKPCARPFLISNIMGLEEEGGSPPPGGPPEEEGGVSLGVSPGPDSDLELNGADEDSIAKVWKQRKIHFLFAFHTSIYVHI